MEEEVEVEDHPEAEVDLLEVLEVEVDHVVVFKEVVEASKVVMEASMEVVVEVFKEALEVKATMLIMNNWVTLEQDLEGEDLFEEEVVLIEEVAFNIKEVLEAIVINLIEKLFCMLQKKSQLWLIAILNKIS